MQSLSKGFNLKRLSIERAFKINLNYLFKRLFKITGFEESYSQFGEDLAIRHLLSNVGLRDGVYVDVGCNHPLEHSNSFKLYLEGWKGITIDLNRDSISLHKVERKADIQVHTAISDEVKEVKVFHFENNKINTIDESFYSVMKDVFKPKSEYSVIETRTLTQILVEENIPVIDLLLIDVEGYDFKVLKSLDLRKYRPKLIVIELHDFKLEEFNKDEIVMYLKSMNYKIIGFLAVNGYFQDENI
ncbi:FkbM family methyltransferase [Pontibacter sp. KCTC 32443]|uniref:FkbM family methyltransferase n=1 Tax=Pontibacter TaxID=323449 RepID=UPI00164D5FC1|nr:MULTISPECIES: FkbM family methyltransferase [Pontibacter]MBC5774244.1 FkbM family methyltransferase [Pontibacter sp. KCTC 32443]